MKKSMRNGSVLALSGLVLCLCFSIACQDKAAIAELEKYKAQSTVEQQNMALVAKTFGELNKKNAGIYQELYAPDYSWYFPANNLKPLTREEEAGFVKLLWDAFPDIRWEIVEMFAGGERVAVRFAVMGTHTNEYQGLPPTGKAFESGGVWIGRFKDGKLVEVREESDVIGWMQQLGMELKPIAAKKESKEVSEKPAMNIEAEKQSVAERFQALVDTAVKGDIEKYKSFFHPEMRWWDFSQKDPVGIEDYTKYMEEFYKSGLKWVSELGPFEIHIIGKTAVLYTTYKNIFKDAEGKETTSSGPWTAVLVKQDDRWMFLSNIFTAK